MPRHSNAASALVALILFSCTCTSAHAQRPPENQPDMTIDESVRARVIDAVRKALNDDYVFPDVASKMDEAIRNRVKNKEYDGITSAKGLATALTDHLQAVSHDKHLRVFYNHDTIPKRPEGQREPTAQDRERMRRHGVAINQGFEKVERLEGNVGLIVFNMFFPAEYAGETAIAAINFLGSTDALIFDLRKNGGGDPATVALICSALFGDESVHLNDLYFRPGNETHQYWTLPYLPVKRYLDKPVYVLTSKRTFSGAEEFTYNLKNLKRATIVGETTGGGANPGGTARLDDHFEVFVPSGRAISPITKTNWEGTGVTPDVTVPADQALQTAYFDALKRIEERAAKDTGEPDGPGEPPMLARERTRALERVRKELDAAKAAPPQS
jgi:hypothetical protein